jgi:hypothetical protein
MMNVLGADVHLITIQIYSYAIFLIFLSFYCLIFFRYVLSIILIFLAIFTIVLGLRPYYQAALWYVLT